MSRPVLILGVALYVALLGRAALADDARLWATFANPTQSEADIDAAIERVVAKMSFLTRPFARAEVKAASPAFRHVTLEAAPGAITVTYDVGKPVRTPSDGSAGQWTRDDGDVYEVRARFENGLLRQSFKNPGGERLNTFVLSPDGRTLTIDVVVSSDRLPEPIRYRLTFERVGP